MARPSAGGVDRPRVEKALIGLAQDRQSGDNNQHALEDGREIFHLVMAVGMIFIGRLRAEANRQSGPPGP